MKGAIMRVVYTVFTIVFTYEGVYTVFTTVFTVFTYEGVYTVFTTVFTNEGVYTVFTTVRVFYCITYEGSTSIYLFEYCLT